MNNLSKQQKIYFAICLIVVLVLGGITFFQKSDFRYKDATDYAAKEREAQIVAEAYRKYLASIQTDPAASQKLFQAIMTQAEIRKQVEDELQPNRKIAVPAVADSELNISTESGQAAVEGYFTEALGPLVAFNQSSLTYHEGLFDDGANSEAASKSYRATLRKVMDAPVPKEALAVQKSLVAAYKSYGSLIDLSQQYLEGQNPQPWADVYAQYAAINQSSREFNAAYNQLVNKYKLADAVIVIPTENLAEGSPSQGFNLIPRAHAIFGLGDLTITVGDIPRIIMDAVKEGLVSSFSTFMSQFLDKLITRIENDYRISNFLYYSDALVTGQYADDYLNKYVGNSLDRQIIKQFIPQFSCNQQNQNLKPIFQAKANQYLGFDPAHLNPSDADYYRKLASVGSFLATPEGWQLYYEELAAETESEAQKSVQQELTSSGLKSPRESLGKSISASINSIVSGQKAAIESIIALGINNAESIISGVVAQITQTLVTKFVFSGATTSPRGGGSVIGVFKEQPTCLAAAQLTPIVPINGTKYQQPPAPPTTEELYQQQCAEYPELCNSPPAGAGNP